MVDSFKKAGLPEPIFEEVAGGLQVTLLKDIYTEEYLRKLNLNKRQVKAVLYIKEHGSITNSSYQQLNNTAHRTAARDLERLLAEQIIDRIGTTGRGTSYVLKRG
jgi:ATP-dependent DNA helicase RecG